jgi:murein DD-endopeptidase MepM/ murein hydrolase activator NlpD
VSWVIVPLLVLRALALVTPVLACFILSSSLAAGLLEQPLARSAAGAAACLLVPLYLRHRLGRFLARRGRRPPPAAGFVAVVDTALAAGLAFGFADDAGRALRRHGDWFVGERNGAVARGTRHVVGLAAAYLERFDPAPEVVALAPPTQPAAAPRWTHPLLGPDRTLPRTSSQRFGAARPQPRPEECQLGHCGVDLFQPRGAPVLAVFDGVVEKLERDAARGGRAGIFLVVAHGGGAVRSRYIHLDEIAPELVPGARVGAGQPIGRLGGTGVFHSSPHLHFGLEVRGRYVDPEPYLLRWALAPAPPSA